MKQKNKNEAQVIIIGFIFIILISSLFLLKARLDKSKNNTLSTNDGAVSAVEKFSSISVANLAKKINAKEKLTIFDLRDANSFSIEHTLDAINLSTNDLTVTTANLDKSETYFFVDDLGLTPTEIQVLNFFKTNGFSHISYLEGGLTEWKNEFEPTISAGDPTSLIDQSKVAYMKSDDLKNILATQKLYIIDVRSGDKYATGHIPGAINIPLAYLESRRHEIPLGLKIIIYDDGGLGAFQGAVKLFDLSILNVYALSDGFSAWQQKGFPIVGQ